MDPYLLPGVELEGGDADVTDLILTGAKQKVPVRPGRQGHLVRQTSFRDRFDDYFKYDQWCKQQTLERQMKDVTATHLQSSGSQVYAGTGNCLRLKPHKHVGPQAIVHVVPVDTEAHTKNT